MRFSPFPLSSSNENAAPQERTHSQDAALQLLAVDADDLAILSAHLQDAIVRVGDISYATEERCFLLAAARFDWLAADQGRLERSACGLRFSHVSDVRHQGVPLHAPDAFLNLLAIRFEEGDSPSGCVRLDFSGGASVQFTVECLEALLSDLGPRWAAAARPGHALET